jgi:hypothetical protein
METGEMVKNARRLYSLLSYEPREYREEPKKYEEEHQKKCTVWNYTFNADDLKSPSLLIGYLKRVGLKWKLAQRGIMVYNITNRQINEARKQCNKPSRKFSIQL